MSERNEIAVVVYTRHDPITVDQNKIAQALSFMGYSAHVIDLDWATPEEWRRLTEPVDVRTLGRHSMGYMPRDQKYTVRWYVDMGQACFVRDYHDHNRDLEEIQ